MDTEEVARKQIATEQEVVPSTIETTMADRMAGQMNHTEAAPEGQFVAVSYWNINSDRLANPQQQSAGTFEPVAPTGNTGVRIGAIDVRLFKRMSIERRPRPGLRPREVADMIEMTMGEQDGLYIVRTASESPQRVANYPGLTDEARIDQDDARVVHQQVALYPCAPNRMETRRHPLLSRGHRLSTLAG